MSSKRGASSSTSGSHAVGYGKAPTNSRFKKGQSGNPHGRPRGKGSKIPYESVLGQQVTIGMDGEPVRVTAAEAFFLNLVPGFGRAPR